MQPTGRNPNRITDPARAFSIRNLRGNMMSNKLAFTSQTDPSTCMIRAGFESLPTPQDQSAPINLSSRNSPASIQDFA
jgi:hypothetical protein